MVIVMVIVMMIVMVIVMVIAMSEQPKRSGWYRMSATRALTSGHRLVPEVDSAFDEVMILINNGDCDGDCDGECDGDGDCDGDCDGRAA